MLTIERLNMRLPPGFEHRAADIAHELASQLSGLGITKAQYINRLALPPITVHAQATNQQIAHSMAAAIQSGIGGNT